MCVQQVNGVKSNAAREESPPMIYGHDNNIIKYRKKTSTRQLQHFAVRALDPPLLKYTVYNNYYNNVQNILGYDSRTSYCACDIILYNLTSDVLLL